MENFNIVPDKGTFGGSVEVVNQNFLLAQQEMETLRNLISPDTKFVTAVATAQTTSVTQVLPETGSADTVYRVGSWDGSQYDPSVYSEYAWNGSAYIKLNTKSQAGEVYDISANHSGAKYADLAAALGTNGANIPQSLRKGGMSVKFVQSSDNKYVQYRLLDAAFSVTVANWIKGNPAQDIQYDSNSVPSNAAVFDGISSVAAIAGITYNFTETSKNLWLHSIVGLKAGKHVGIKINSLSGVSAETNVIVQFVKYDGTIITKGFIPATYTDVAIYGMDDDMKAIRMGTNPSQNCDIDYDVIIEGNTQDIEILTKRVSDVESKVDDISNVLGTEYDYSASGVNQKYYTIEGLKARTKIGIKINSLSVESTVSFFTRVTGSSSNVDVISISADNEIHYMTLSGDADIFAYYINSGASAAINFTLYFCGLAEQVNELTPKVNNLEGYVDKVVNVTGVRQYDYYSELITQKKDITITILENAATDKQIDLFGFLPDGAGYIYLATIADVNQPCTVYLSESQYLFAFIRLYRNEPITSAFKFQAEYIGSVAELRRQVEEEAADNYFEIADNGLLDSALVNSASTHYLKKKSINTSIYQHDNECNADRIVAINHDDFNLSDIEGTRWVYNKYGFKANFNFIFVPLTKASKNSIISATKQLLKEGHKIGLHAYMGKSFWYMNKGYDVTPAGSYSFAPPLSFIKGNNSDGTGVNGFGDNITTETKFSDVGFVSAWSQDRLVYNSTEEQYRDLLKQYCVYFNTETIAGLKLDDTEATMSSLQWCEYFYNELIDSTLGYSSTAASYQDRFAADYEIPSGGNLADYYPDAEHLLNGKIVFYDDVNNPNYNNAEYQKVGRFSKGLFKGAASCCNYEVTDRIIQTATAFCRHYFGMIQFDNFGRHGVKYMDRQYKDSNNVSYIDQQHTKLDYEGQKLYCSIQQQWLSQHDALLSNHIRIKNHNYDVRAQIKGHNSLFLGRHGIVDDNFNTSEYINYLCTITPNRYTQTQPSVDYSTFMQYAAGVKDYIKWAYENAGDDISGNGTMYMSYNVKSVIDLIMSDLGTGKIPTLSLDTIRDSASIIAAVEIVALFCYKNGIKIVGFEEARKISCKPRVLEGNIFPNPSFNQTLLRNLNGQSSKKTAYIPDGWSTDKDTIDILISEIEYNGVSYKAMAVENIGSSNVTLKTKIWGLPAGLYALSALVKTTNLTESPFVIRKALTTDYAGTEDSIIESSNINSEFEQFNVDIDIKAPHRTVSDDSVKSVLSNGYVGNDLYISAEIVVEPGKTVTISKPMLSK